MNRIIAILLAIFMSACGGGGSSDGGGGGANPYTGTYIGTVTATFSAPGVPSMTESFAITVEINADGTVRIIDEEGTFSTGNMNGNSFSITDFVTSTENDVSCSGTQTFSGTVEGATISGQITASFSCTKGSQGPVHISVSGTLSASKPPVTSVVVPVGNWQHGLTRTLREMLEQ